LDAVGSESSIDVCAELNVVKHVLRIKSLVLLG
jgi:hypothetical protein